MAIITLTTDLGLSDYYVGAVKGKILKEAEDVQIIDISHQIRPFDAFHAAFVIKNAYPDFPSGTIHIVNVESDNIKSSRYLLIVHKEQIFIGHDNGIYFLVFDGNPEEVYELDVDMEKKYTFPARDVMAEVACHIKKGKSPEELGKRIYNIQGLSILQPVVYENSIRGNIIYIDRYENVMVNIKKDMFDEVRQGRRFNILFKRNEFISNLSERYSEVQEGDKLAFFNSAGYLELAINKGKASSLLGLKLSDFVQIDFE